MKLIEHRNDSIEHIFHSTNAYFNFRFKCCIHLARLSTIQIQNKHHSCCFSHFNDLNAAHSDTETLSIAWNFVNLALGPRYIEIMWLMPAYRSKYRFVYLAWFIRYLIWATFWASNEIVLSEMRFNWKSARTADSHSMKMFSNLKIHLHFVSLNVICF